MSRSENVWIVDDDRSILTTVASGLRARNFEVTTAPDARTALRTVRDGAIDVLFGDWFGHVWLHRNRGTSAKPDFDLAGVKLLMTNGSPIKVGPIGGDPKTNFNALQGARTVVAAGDYISPAATNLLAYGETWRGILEALGALPHEGMSLTDSHEEA